MSTSSLRFCSLAVLATLTLFAPYGKTQNDKDFIDTNVISTFHDAIASIADRQHLASNFTQDEQWMKLLTVAGPEVSSYLSGMDIFKLMDIFKKLNAKPTNTSTRCEWDLYRISQGLQKTEMWAMTMIDAFGKPGSGIFQGNYRWPGSFSLCRSVVSQDNFTLPPITGQYCSLNLNISSSMPEAFHSMPEVRIGLCMPESCSSTEASFTINNSVIMPLIKDFLVFDKVTCMQPQKPFWKDIRALVPFIILMGFLLVMTLGTLYDLHKRHFFRSLLPQLYRSKPSNYSVNGQDLGVNNVNGDGSPGGGSTFSIDTQTAVLPIKEENGDPFAASGIAGKLLLAFSVYTNGSKLLNTSPGKGSLPVLNGIRFFSLTWVILGHTYSISIAQMDNVVVFINRIGYLAMQTVLQGTVSVDSFFVLSGLLLTYLYLKEHERTDGKISWVKFYVHRYCRLTPTYILVMFLITNGLWAYWGDGPYWPQGGFEGEHCYKSWWWNMLYINNFQNAADQCMGHTWYLANDMQFYIISPIFLIALTRSVPLAGGIAGVFLLASWITTGVIATQVNNPAYFDITTLIGAVYMDYFNRIYIKPYCRIGPYIVGMACGWLLFKTKCNYKMKKWMVILGWMLAAACNLSVIYGLYDTKPSTEISSLYYALSRTAWGIGLSWVIFACCNGYGGIVTSILNLSIWNPLSRLTYCAYLWHISFIVFDLYNSEILPHYAPGFSMAYKYVANVVFSYVGAFFISLAFESPIMTIEKIILGR